MRKVFFVLLLALMLLPLTGQDAPREDALELYRNGNYERAIEVCRGELDVYSSDQVNKILDSYTVMCWSLIRLDRYDDVIRYGRKR